MMFTCADCTIVACLSGELEKMPKNCPMRDQAYFDQVLEEYLKPENHDFFLTSTAIEALGYCRWPRLREIAEFARRMNYTRLGIAFCVGLHKEAAIVARLLRKQGFEVVSVVCKAGSIPKTKVGVTAEMTFPSGAHEVMSSPTQTQLLGEAMCNPIAQAQLLNQAKTQFNICLGLCVGHDSLFYKYSEAPVTTLVAKDRVTGHNPVAAIYCADGYFEHRATIQEEE